MSLRVLIIHNLSPLLGGIFTCVLHVFIMTFDFDTLFTEYLATCDDWCLPRTVQGFIDATNGSIQNCLDDGLEPDDAHLFIMSYVTDMLASDPDFLTNYAS